MKRNILILGFVFLAIIAVVVMNQTNKQGTQQGATLGTAQGDVQLPESPVKGAMAPRFELASLDGAEQYQVGGERDKLLIINFWAAWCGPCEEEAPDLVDIYNEHQGQLDIYAVNATNYDKLREAKDFVKEQGFEFPVLTDAKGTAGDLYKVFSYPTSFIVNREGIVVERIEGIISRKQWEKYLDNALAS
ncbi:MAG: TlpA disulfide reductase family protein [Candidatus Cohnella colombiensis]|uniref:TlpA disulfide reductase family protein n=1 Tax=Candidatus Cohnella colombiensis TaxID=3121368 RepID=A0AA95EXQ6_9BACL|nr:MAG: TlpA disulfide reductase family protein [Cohnella sp.]